MKNNVVFQRRSIWGTVFIIIMVLAITPSVFSQRTRVEPGFNLFSVQQDVELGSQAAQNAEKQLPMLNHKSVDDYLNRLGKRLSSYAPGEKYPYQFKCVNDSNINAFALPGGFLFINRGVIENADNEAELASVIGHEIGHVALRHGTNQVSKSQITQFPLAILGGLFGQDSIGALLTQLGAGFTVNSILLKYSRNAERQSDLIGTQILFDGNYDPKYVADFFEKLDAGGRGTDFFSSHPHPENRIEKINQEISKLGYRSGRRVNNSTEFDRIKSLVKSLPPAPKSNQTGELAPSGEGTTRSEGMDTGEARPAAPSSQFRGFFSEYIRLRYPENWKVFGHEREFTLTPDGGILNANDDSAIAYGVSVTVYDIPETDRAGIDLEEATSRLMEGLRRSNPSMRLIRDRGRIRVDGRRALSAVYENASPLEGREIDWVVTVMRPEGLTAFIFVAPEQDYEDYVRTFEKILDSIDFTNR